MLDPELPRIDRERWRDHIHERMAAGCVWEAEYPAHGRIQGALGDCIECRPVIILRRFTEGEDILIGCRMLQFDSAGQLERHALLDAQDILFFLGALASDQQLCGLNSFPRVVRLASRSNFQLSWEAQGAATRMTVNVACARCVELCPVALDQLVCVWKECLHFLHELS